MLALGLVLNTLGIGLFCWAIFALAVYALPFFVASSIGMLAFHSGAGVIGALLIGTAAGALDACHRSDRRRRYSVVDLARCDRDRIRCSRRRCWLSCGFALRRSRVPSPAWREVFACLGAVCVGGTAWTRLTVFAEARPFEPVGAVEKPSQPILTAATREG